MTPAVVRYGPEPDQFAQLWQPARPATPPTVVVLVHGGYWRHRYRCDLMDVLYSGWRRSDSRSASATP